jgi:DNA mismatch endonuclease (patch repair protein)
MPKSKLEFWQPKLTGNRLRDEKVRAELQSRDWTVIEVWECETKPEHLQRLIARLRNPSLSRVIENRSGSKSGTKVRK